jgi:hypothetical protein
LPPFVLGIRAMDLMIAEPGWKAIAWECVRRFRNSIFWRRKNDVT